MQARMQQWKEREKSGETISLESFRRESIEREQERRHVERIDQSVSKIPERFQGKQFENYLTETPEQERIKQVSERFVTTFTDRLKQGSNAMFLGKPGTGKTFLSLIMYQALVRSGFTVHYESSLGFLKILQEKHYKSISDYRLMIDYYRRVQFLILDEVTESINKTGMPSECDKKILFDVINARYETFHVCTLIVSNRDKQELVSRLGKPLIDRLSENSISMIFNWDSFRQRKKDQ